MIVLIQMSPRRYLTIDTAKREGGWTSISTRGFAQHGDDVVIYARGEIVAGPADYDTVMKGTAQYAADRKELVPWVEWDKIEKERAAEVDRKNAEIQAARKARPGDRGHL